MYFESNYINQNKFFLIINTILCLSIFFWSVRYNSIQLKYFILFLIFPTFYYNYKNFKHFIKYALLCSALLFHSYFQLEFFSSYSFYSIFFLFFLLLIFDYYFIFFIKNLKNIILIFCIIFFLLFFLFYLKFESFLLKDFVCDKCNYTFLFEESSHFAITVLPLIYYLIFFNFYNNYIKSIFLILFFIICYLNPSVTFFVGLILMLFLSLIFNLIKIDYKKFMFISFIIFVVLSQNYNRLSNITDIFISSKTHANFPPERHASLSADVYKNSLFIAKNSILNKPLGHGFNNYYIAFEKFVNQNNNLYHPQTKYLNKQDGSNNFAKLITEFGIFSILIFYVIIVFILNKKIDKKIKVLFLLPIIIQLFVRGVGYFNGGFIFYMLCIYFYQKNPSLIKFKESVI